MTIRNEFISACLWTIALGAVAATGFYAVSAHASVGAHCSHTTECDGDEVMHARQYCLADSPSSTSGHCVRLHILP